MRHHQAGQEWVPHWHTEWSFGAVISGQCRCSLAGRLLHLRAGDLLAIAPGEVHMGLVETQGDAATATVLIVMLYVPDPWLQAHALHAPRGSGVSHLPALAQRARELDTADTVRQWLSEALPQWGTTDGPPATDRPSPAEKALLRQMRHAAQDGVWQVADLARRCGVSRERLHQVARRWLGMAPSDYLRVLRLHQARELLAEQHPPAQVAAECGFADQAHFTRWFRRAFGYTPGDWLAALSRPAATPWPEIPAP